MRRKLLLSAFALSACCALRAAAVEPPDLAGKQHLAELIQARDPAAIPLLAEEFRQTTDERQRRRIAATLVKLGAEDRSYFDLLATEARKAIETDMPFPLGVDDSGELVKGVFTAEFLAWCRVHGADPADTAWQAIYDMPADVALLAQTGDRRAYPLLSQAMLSANPQVVFQAARGLALLHDERAVGTLIRRLRREPKAIATVMAVALAYFDDPRARQAIEEFFPDKGLLEELRKSVELERAQDAGPPSRGAR